MFRIRSAAVIGAGTMGAAIAAHLANCGIRCLLFDIVPKDASDSERSSIAFKAIKKMAKAKPAPLYDNADADLLKARNLEDDFDQLKDVDWIVEAVPEVLSIKKDLFARINAIHQQGQLVTSNTSGISLADIVADCSDTLKSHVCICHFFNPPRYMHLLELVQGSCNDELFQALQDFASISLGKGVVIGKDTPNFIANRIGAFDMCKGLELMQSMNLRVEEVDALAGPLLGRPKSALCRLLDLVGIDIIGHVNANIYHGAPDDESRDIFAESPLCKKMIDAGQLGDKTGAGFYRKGKDDTGKRIIESLDLNSMDYVSQIKPDAEVLGSAKKIRDIGERIRHLIADEQYGDFVWQLISSSLCYAANRVPEIADDIVSVDRAMRWGFNWQFGPFELWDAIGIDYICERLKAENRDIPSLVQAAASSEHGCFYHHDEFFNTDKQLQTLVEHPHILHSRNCDKIDTDFDKNCSMWNLGDGIAALEIHSPNNTLSIDVLAAIREAITKAEASYDAMVLCARGDNFSFGANLKEMLQVVADKGIDAVGEMISNFQLTSMMLKHSSIPTVAAAKGMILGGGCEFVMHCDRVQAAPEVYMGLVEAGVGILPAGAGTKEFAVRASHWAGTDNSLFPAINDAMQLIGMAQTSTSAKDAINKGYLRNTDFISMNKECLLYDAKQSALQLVNQHYRPPVARNVRVMGRSGIGEFEARVHNMREAGHISAHDQIILNKIASVICGGDVPSNSIVSHQHLLDLEREAFLFLLGTEKSQQRVEHTMKTGKPLRN